MKDGWSTVAAVGSFLAAGACATFLLTERLDGRESASLSYERLFEQTPDGQVVLDDDGTVLEANPAAERLLAPRTLQPGAVLTEVLPETTPLVSASGRSRAELTIETDADRRSVEAEAVPLSPDDGAASRLVTLRETTDRRRVEKQYQELIENASDLVVVLDEEGTITFAGPSFERVLGYDPDELVGTDVLTEVHPEDRANLKAAFERLLEDPDESQRFEYRVRSGDGDWRILEGIGRNLLSNSVVQGLVVNSRDITERKEREHDLERQNERLEKFANVVSHDLRNPLQIAKGHMERAEITGEDPPFAEVRKAHERIETLIEDVLTLARQGQSVAETETVELDTIARDAWNTVDTGSMTLSVEGDCRLAADPARLRQLFENLFRNALEHAGSETTVTVGPIEPMHTTTRIGRESPSGFYVADDGPGIPAEDRADVLDSGYTTAAEGTGFGLAIVAEIAEAHRWQTTVTESRDGGARFEFTEQLPDQQLTPE